MAARHKARLWALQILYRIDLNPDDLVTVFDDFRRAYAIDEHSFQFTTGLVEGVRQHLAELDEIIERVAANWRVARMSTTDRNILRLGVYELLHCPDTPPFVVIDQSIILAKKFGSEESGKFVNGILDRIHHSRKD